MKKALVIGVPYQAPYTIESIPYDITDLQQTLSYRGFTSIQTLSTAAQTTASSLNAALRAFCGGLLKGDRAAIVMVGHGSRIPDVSGDESDGYDEALAGSDLQLLTDDQINAALKLAPAGTIIDLAQDICYAGTADRSPLPSRSQPMRIGVGSGTKPAYYRAWQSSQEGQLSWGCISNGIPRSLYTLYLAWALRAYPFNPCTEIHGVVSSLVASVADQNPVLSGPYLDAVPF